jgi:omega-hydroxy-beta-dihydromenaquinone-9 sulfotransferase
MERGLIKPVIIIGTGRCGSTLLHNMISMHPRVAWLSTACARWPTHPERNRLVLHLVDLPVVGRAATILSRPTEPYPFWEEMAKGFSEPIRDLRAGDVTVHTRNAVRAGLQSMLTPNRHRLVVKITGWPRIGYLGEILPDAIFVHVIRDPRAVVNSLLQVGFWRGWRGPANWRWGQLPPPLQEEWENSNRSFVILAALQWKILVDAVEEAKQALPADRFLEVRYEDLISVPVDELRRLMAGCHLDWPAILERRVQRIPLGDMNVKWRKDLTDSQQRLLEGCLKMHAARYGYCLD